MMHEMDGPEQSDRRGDGEGVADEGGDRGPDRRGSVLDRRVGADRRLQESSPPTGFERRRGVGRRLSDFTKAAEEGEMTREQFLFLQAVEAFKKANNKPYPSWTDVLEVVRLLGYRKTMSSEVTLPSAEDWTEAPDAPSQVKSLSRLRAEERSLGRRSGE